MKPFEYEPGLWSMAIVLLILCLAVYVLLKYVSQVRFDRPSTILFSCCCCLIAVLFCELLFIPVYTQEITICNHVLSGESNDYSFTILSTNSDLYNGHGADNTMRIEDGETVNITYSKLPFTSPRVYKIDTPIKCRTSICNSTP